jgi:periplasmic protein TonB
MDRRLSDARRRPSAGVRRHPGPLLLAVSLHAVLGLILSVEMPAIPVADPASPVAVTIEPAPAPDEPQQASAEPPPPTDGPAADESPALFRLADAESFEPSEPLAGIADPPPPVPAADPMPPRAPADDPLPPPPSATPPQAMPPPATPPPAARPPAMPPPATPPPATRPPAPQIIAQSAPRTAMKRATPRDGERGVDAAPVRAPNTLSSPAAAPAPSWTNALAIWLQRHRTYPPEARNRNQQGQVTIRFTVMRDGSVSEVRLVQGSGVAVLDDAALAMLRGARVPVFPDDMADPTVTVSVPILYRLER